MLPPPPRCTTYTLVQATVGVGTIMIVYVILFMAKLLHCVRTAWALRAHCMHTACILRTQRPGYSPKNTFHLTGCAAKQQSPHENDETAFNLVLHCPYEQTTQPCKVRLLRVFRCPWLCSWRRR